MQVMETQSTTDEQPGVAEPMSVDPRAMTPEELGEALLRYRSGHANTFTTIVQACEERMWRTARRYAHCDQDATDAVQDAWVSFIRRAHTIRDPRALRSWLQVTTANAAIQACRRRSRETPVDWDVPEPESEDLPDNVVDLVARREAVRRAVDDLPQADGDLIWMLFETEMSYAEIAARIGRAVGGIGPTRGRLLRKLRNDNRIQRWAYDESA